MTKIKIGLFGFGVVGQGIYEVVRKSKNAHAEIVKICVRDPKKPRKIEVDPSLFTTSVDDILDNQNINLVVEVIDDADAAYNIVKRAMLRGIPVVSGSKTMLAKHLPELIEIQKTRNVALLYDASSCGSIPVIRNLEEYYDNDLLLEVKGILNGSSNYILSRVFDHKDSYANALAQAQALGFAESDPSFDIEGYDSLFKLVIITVHALGTYVAPERIFTYGISTIHDSDIQYAREKNVKIKLVAQVVKVSDEHFTMFVMPEFVTPAKYIYSVDDEYNGVVIRGECYDRQFMFGKGAGSLPTASSILSDIMARLNNYRYEYKKMNYIEKPDYTTDITLKIYARYKETDVQGILNFSKIHEQFISEESNYVIGEIQLRELLEKRSQLSGRDVFLATIPFFFLSRDETEKGPLTRDLFHCLPHGVVFHAADRQAVSERNLAGHRIGRGAVNQAAAPLGRGLAAYQITFVGVSVPVRRAVHDPVSGAPEKSGRRPGGKERFEFGQCGNVPALGTDAPQRQS